MYEIHIFISVDSANTRKSKKTYQYRMTWKKEVREGAGEIEGTLHEATLQALVEAMRRIFQSTFPLQGTTGNVMGTADYVRKKDV